MTILPGSLDYLYYNGILDHIPYEAYEMSPIVGRGNGKMQFPKFSSPQMNSQNVSGMQMGMPNVQGQSMAQASYSSNFGMNGMNSNNMYASGDYLNSAMQGSLYNNYNTQDSFVTSYQQPITGMRESQMGASSSIKDTIVTTTNNVKSKISGLSPSMKGLLGAGILLLTGIAFVKGGRKRAKVKKGAGKSFWSKINPKNWGKKAELPPPAETKKTFWQKLGFNKNK